MAIQVTDVRSMQRSRTVFLYSPAHRSRRRRDLRCQPYTGVICCLCLGAIEIGRLASSGSCMKYRKSISIEIVIKRVFILPVIVCEAETWSPTRQLLRNVDAFDQCCLRRILRICWRDRISPLTHIIRTTRLKFFGHIARADPSMDHS